MKANSDAIVVAAARFFTPLMALFALMLLAGRGAGGGVGFVAGMGFGLLLLLHALTFGAAAARSAFPPILARLVLALGVVGVCAGVGWTLPLPNLFKRFRANLEEERGGSLPNVWDIAFVDSIWASLALAANSAVPIIGSPKLATPDLLLWQGQLGVLELAAKGVFG